MKKTFIQKKGIGLLIFGVLLLLGGGAYFLIHKEFDQGSLTLGIVFIVMGILYYFRKNLGKDMPDEMSRKNGTTAMAVTQQIALIIIAILYIVNTRRYAFSFSVNDIFARFIFGSLFLNIGLQRYYKKHMNKIPF